MSRSPSESLKFMVSNWGEGAKAISDVNLNIGSYVKSVLPSNLLSSLCLVFKDISRRINV